MSTRRDVSKDVGFIEWYKTQEKRKLSDKELVAYDSEVEGIVKKEITFLSTLSVQDYAYAHKQYELQTWVPKQEIKNIEWVRKLIWKPIAKSDYRRIQPELIQIKSEFAVKSFNIWGEEGTRVLKNIEPLSKHWDILRTLISRATNDGTVGRQLRFLVRDKNTRLYLGVICISSAMFRIPSIHDEIGWDREKNKRKGGKLVCLANGQTIVPTQPFGNVFLGGKLLALLCLSKDVVDAWEREYGDKLVGVHTTSLWGTNEGTQYDNLSPYWNKLKDSMGTAPLKPRNNVFEVMMTWMRERYPEDYYKHFIEKGDDGMLNMREHKSYAIAFCYRKFGIKKYDSNFQRGVYSSFLYKNSKEYLRDEIDESQLEPAFDNSIEGLTNFWRFGSMGDTTEPNEEMKRLINNIPKEDIQKFEKKREQIKTKIRMKGQTKGNIDFNYKDKPIPLKGGRIDWYLNLHSMTWDEIQKKYSGSP